MDDMSWSSAEERAKRQAEELSAIMTASMLGAHFQNGWQPPKSWSTLGDYEVYHSKHEAAIGFLEIVGVVEVTSPARRARLRMHNVNVQAGRYG